MNIHNVYIYVRISIYIYIYVYIYIYIYTHITYAHIFASSVEKPARLPPCSWGRPGNGCLTDHPAR